MAIPTQIFDQRYILREQLGVGGMGSVYKAQDRLSGDVVALKRVFAAVENLLFTTVSPDGDDDLRVALAREFQTLASLRHPNIISVLEYGFDEDHQPYFTMELLEGARSLINAARLQSDAVKFDYVVQMLQALDYLYRRGILHRDLKPANVLVVNNHVKILDFGLAISHNYVPKEAVGTVSYMAPEVLEEQPPTVASDLFAAGIMIFELFAGEHPFIPTGNVMEMIYRITLYDPDWHKLKLPEPALDVVKKLLEKNPAHRYQTARDVLQDWAEAFDHALPEETEDIRESYLQAAKMVGRQNEIQQLEQALDRLRTENKGSAWLIGGESGVGKSRLLEEIRVRALVKGIRVLRGECTARSGVAYESWRQPLRHLVLNTDLTDLQVGILRQIVPDITSLLRRDIADSTYSGRQALQDTIVSVIHSQTAPLVIILEDLQWAAESLEVVKRLTRAIEQFPILILGSFRNDESPGLSDTLPDMQVLNLERLQADEIQELAFSMIGNSSQSDRSLIKFLQAQTEGNLFFLVEVLRALAEEAGRLELVGRATLPIQVFTGGMQAIIRRRLSYVPAWGRRLLQLAAITGREIDLRVLEVLRQSLESPPELEKWLLTCANVAVLEVREGVWRFAHDKLREGALLELERHEEVELHRQVALAIENIYGDSPEQAARLVTHWDMAGDARKRGYYARIAGQKALEISIYADAIRYFRLALAWAEDQSNAQDRAEILCKIGTAYRYMGDYPNALPLLEESLLIAETGQDLVTMTEALRQLGSIENNQGRYTDALNRFTASLELARQTGNQEIEGLVISNLGDVNRSLGNTEAAISYHQQALGIARHLNNPWQEGISLDNLGGVYHDLGQLKRAIEYRQEAVALFVAIGNRRSESIAHANLGTSYQSSGHYANALEHYQKALTIAQDIGDVVGEGICLDKLGDAYHDLGNWQLAQEYYLKTLYISRQVGNRRNEANRLEDLAMVYLHLYQFEQAIESAEMAYTIAQELGDANAQVLYGTTLGWVLLAHQKVDPARAIVHRVMKNFPDNPHLYQAAVCFGIICLHDQHPSGAQRAFNQAIELAQQVLAATPANYRAEYVIALATTGLALLRERPMEEAIAAYHKSRALASHKGLREEEMRRLIEMERSNIGKVREVFQVLTT